MIKVMYVISIIIHYKRYDMIVIQYNSNSYYSHYTLSLCINYIYIYHYISRYKYYTYMITIILVKTLELYHTIS